jgi:hypothetical protein
MQGPPKIPMDPRNYTDLGKCTGTSETIQRPPKLYGDLRKYPETSQTTQRPPKIYRDLRKYTQTSKTIPRLKKLHRNIQKLHTALKTTDLRNYADLRNYRYLRSYKQTYESAPKNKTTQGPSKAHTDLQNYKKKNPPQRHRTPRNMHKTTKTTQTLPNLCRHIRNYKDILSKSLFTN